jgi:hypothetical protein
MTALRLSSVSKLSRPFASGSLFCKCRRLKSTNPGILRKSGNDNDIETLPQPGKSRQTPQPYDFRVLRPKPVSPSKDDELYLGPDRVKRLRIIRYPFSRDRRGGLLPYLITYSTRPIDRSPRHHFRRGGSLTGLAVLALYRRL